MKILVAGASGLIGRALLERAAAKKIATVALARSKPEFPLPGEFRNVDLLDRTSCDDVLSDLRDFTHLVYTAWQPRETRGAEVEPNLAMFVNVLAAVEKFSRKLRHITLLQGAKAYGSHLGQFKTPALETDPRHMPPNFYYDQQDHLAAAQNDRGWAWTIFRPTTVFGFTTGMPMNITPAIAAYAVLSRRLGLPLRYPASERGYDVLREGVDADLVADAILWAAEAPQAANQIFNITNGDQFRWRYLWPTIAEYFQMEVADPQLLPLAEFMSQKGSLWDEIVRSHGLTPVRLERLAAWKHVEYNLNRPFDNVLSTIKLRQSGFHGYVSTPDMFRRQFERMRECRIIP